MQTPSLVLFVGYTVFEAAADELCHVLYEFRHFVYFVSTVSRLVLIGVPPKRPVLGWA
jgi:hypothetical protein